MRKTSKRKTFKRGDHVEVQREPGHTVKWEPAIYREDAGVGPEIVRMPGHHVVDLDASAPPRYIDSMSGMEVADPDSNPRAYATRMLIVPSRRIRIRTNAVT